MNFRRRDLKLKVKYEPPAPQWIPPAPGNITANVNRMMEALAIDQNMIVDVLRQDPLLRDTPVNQIIQTMTNIRIGIPAGSNELLWIQDRVTRALASLLQPFMEAVNTMVQPLTDVIGVYAQALANMVPNMGITRQHFTSETTNPAPTGSEINQKSAWELELYRLGYKDTYKQIMDGIQKHFPEFEFNHLEEGFIWSSYGNLLYRGKTFEIYLTGRKNDPTIQIKNGINIDIRVSDLTQLPTILDMCCFILGDKTVQLPNDWKVLL